MDSDWLDAYIKAWVRHGSAGDPKSGAADMDRLLSFMDEALVYEDVPTALVFHGHDGFRKMAAQAHQMASDLHFTVLRPLIDGNRFAFETDTRGTNTGAVGDMQASNKPFLLRGVSVGTISPEGKVLTHRDYWDLAIYLRQIGLLPS